MKPHLPLYQHKIANECRENEELAESIVQCVAVVWKHADAKIPIMGCWLLAVCFLQTTWVLASEGLINQESIANAKDVEIQVFNQSTGKPAGKIGYHEIKRTRPKLGPLTVNLQVLRISDFRVVVNMVEAGDAGFHAQMVKFMEARPLRFVEAVPASLVGISEGEVKVSIRAGKAKFDRKGGLLLGGGVKWLVGGKEGARPQARLVYDGKSWGILDQEGRVLAEFRFCRD